MSNHRFINVTVTNFPETSEVEINAELPADLFGPYRNKALKKMGENLAMPGFRKGHIPTPIIEKNVGGEGILREAADLAISTELPSLFIAEEVLPLTTPQVTIKKLAFGDSFVFSVRVEIVPEMELPDYMSIAKKYEKGPDHPEVPEAEFNETLAHITREQARIKKVESGMEAAQASEEALSIKDTDLPPLEPDFVTSLGYDSLEHFKEQLRHNLSHEKARKEHEKQRISLLDALVSKTNVQLPSTLVSHELDKMMSQLEEDLNQANLTFEQYLEHAQKTPESLRAEWTPAAVKRATIQLILSKIAQKENITPDNHHVEQLSQRTLSEYPHLTAENVRSYYIQQLRNEAVLAFLENQGNTTEPEHS